jgi:hypothetical protein
MESTKTVTVFTPGPLVFYPEAILLFQAIFPV